MVSIVFTLSRMYMYCGSIVSILFNSDFSSAAIFVLEFIHLLNCSVSDETVITKLFSIHVSDNEC